MILQEIRKKHTKVTKVLGSWSTFLVIDHQSFQVVDGRSRKEANWYAKMLAIALKRFLDSHR